MNNKITERVLSDGDKDYTESKVCQDFILTMAKKHDKDINSIVIGVQYGDIVVQSYNEGMNATWETLEFITLK